VKSMLRCAGTCPFSGHLSYLYLCVRWNSIRHSTFEIERIIHTAGANCEKHVILYKVGIYTSCGPETTMSNKDSHMARNSYVKEGFTHGPKQSRQTLVHLWPETTISNSDPPMARNRHVKQGYTQKCEDALYVVLCGHLSFFLSI
jgi:hypothetical protein